MKTYSELSKNHQGAIPYGELLKTIEWSDCREIILKKFSNKCSDCGTLLVEKFDEIPLQEKKIYKKVQSRNEAEIELLTKRIADQFNVLSSGYKLSASFPLLKYIYKGLDIHHKYYIRNLLPWEYHDALVPLCRSCHILAHQNNYLRIYENSIAEPVWELAMNCDRCDATGYLDQYSYYMSGICFKCDGRGILVTKK